MDPIFTETTVLILLEKDMVSYIESHCNIFEIREVKSFTYTVILYSFSLFFGDYFKGKKAGKLYDEIIDTEALQAVIALRFSIVLLNNFLKLYIGVGIMLGYLQFL